MRVENSANGTTEHVTWREIDWKQAERRVRNLRQRIFKASQAGDLQKVRNLQKLMLRSHSNVVLSVRRVTQENAGKRTAGVDGKVALTAETKQDLVKELVQSQPWKVQPARRVYIPKANGKRRPLGIPTLLDRAHQARVKNALEPQWEASFEATSYGFRPGRRTHDAIKSAWAYLRPMSRKVWVLDADIKGAFDNIHHNTILKAIENFPARELIKQWLKAGYVEHGQMFDTPTGTPQGGVISPLLANIALHGMEQALGMRRYGPDGTLYAHNRFGLVRYADDFLVFCRSPEDTLEAKSILTAWLAERGLEFSEDKTRIVHVQEGFDFLGVHMRQYKKRGAGPDRYIGLVKPSQSALKRIRKKLSETIKRHYGSTAKSLVNQLNPIIRGWAQYYCWFNSAEIFQSLDNYLFGRLWWWAKRTHSNKNRSWIKAQYFGRFHKTRTEDWIFGDRESGTYVGSMAWYKIRTYVMVKGKASPDDASLRAYFASRSRSYSYLTAKQFKLAEQQNHRCPVCGVSIYTGEQLDIHHMILDRSKAERYDAQNQRLLHRTCHQQVHGAKGSNLPSSAKGLL